jgi:hypothetical protein
MKVFISHAADGKTLARRVAATLREAGFEVWSDDSEILPGENWAARIAEALQESEAMVVLLTPSALRSSHVRHEISYALGKQNYSGRLIPVLAGPPGELPKDEIPWILNSLQMVSLPGHGQDEQGLRKITQALMAVA